MSTGLLRFATVLVGVDFSASSVAALDEAIELAAGEGARVVALHAYRVSPVGAAILGWAELDAAVAASADRELGDIVRTRRRSGVQIIPVVRRGKPEEQIRELADEMGAELIVLGARRRRHAWDALVRGHVANRVMRTASAPVLTLCSSRPLRASPVRAATLTVASATSAQPDSVRA